MKGTEQDKLTRKQQRDAEREALRKQIVQEKAAEGYRGFALMQVVGDELKRRLEEKEKGK